MTSLSGEWNLSEDSLLELSDRNSSGMGLFFPRVEGHCGLGSAFRWTCGSCATATASATHGKCFGRWFMCGGVRVVFIYWLWNFKSGMSSSTESVWVPMSLVCVATAILVCPALRAEEKAMPGRGVVFATPSTFIVATL